MEEVKKDKTSCNIIIIIILMIMVLGLGGYIFYEKVMSKDSDVTTPKTEEKTEELDVANKTVVDLMKMVSIGHYSSSSYYFTENDKVLANNLSERVKLDLIRNMVSDDEYKEFAAGRVYSLTPTQVEQKLANMFGENYTFNKNNIIGKDTKNYFDGCNILVYYGNVDLYMKNTVCGGIDDRGDNREIIKAVKTNDTIEINQIIYYYDETNYYTDHEYKNKMDAVRTKDESLPNPSKFKDELHEYKYTFKLNSDNTYYFYSLEKVK